MKIKIVSVILISALSLLLGWADSWEALKQNGTQIKSVKADFVQEKHLKILARPIISRGIFIFKAPDSLRWEYKSPVRSILLMYNGKSKKFMERDGRLVEESGLSLEATQMIIQEISQWLAGNFNDNPSFTASLETGRRIILVPKNQTMARLISKIELKLSDQPGMLTSVIIYEGPDSFTRLTFLNTELNQQTDDSLFVEK